MPPHYTIEKNAQILISLLKAHGIKKVIASPGTTHFCFVGSVQSDPYFEIYSCVDERSAAYMACGMAAESGEPVVISCTGATAARNYVPALTEAFYRKLPVLAVTGSQHLEKVGHMSPQLTDRSQQMKDLVTFSLQCPPVRTAEDEKWCALNINRAILALTHKGGGPAHINLVTDYSRDFSVKELPRCTAIRRYGTTDALPGIAASGVAVFVGSHRPFTHELEEAVNSFCEAYNGVVITDHTSGYGGKYRAMPALCLAQAKNWGELRAPELLVHIGEVGGAYYGFSPKRSWRVCADGEARGAFSGLEAVFEMDELSFFKAYADKRGGGANTEASLPLFEAWSREDAALREKIDENALPFSNIWAALKTAPRLPAGSVLHFGILNSLRSWNFFCAGPSVKGFCNTGGFGIDGCASSLLGASLASPDKLFFGVVGDLAFFYDMNSIGNRHAGKNLRIMLVNNGAGVEMQLYTSPVSSLGPGGGDAFLAAAGHYGNKSRDLVRHYAEDLGFEYLCADSKESFMQSLDAFVNPQIGEAPILFELFADTKAESDALKYMRSLDTDPPGIKASVKAVARNILGEKGVKIVKSILKRD